MRFLTPFVFIFGLAVALAVAGVVWVGVSFNQFQTVTSGGLQNNCKPVIGITGAGDIDIVPDTQFAYLSSMDRRANAERGAIYRFNLGDPLDDGSWRDRTGGQPVLFDPAGIDIYHAPLPDGRWLTRVFVVNRAGPEVVLYDVEPNGDLVLRERFSDTRLTSPNDVVATGPRSFFVTNETLSSRSSLRRRIDFFLGLKTGYMLEYDGATWAKVVDGLSFPNGLALSDDGRKIVLAEMRSKSLIRFMRDPRTDVLTPNGSVQLDTFPDNMAFDEEGNMIVGAVPQPLAFSSYSQGLRELAPSMILRIAEDGTTETLFSDPGERLSAATVGVPLDGKLLIGSNAADRFLMCEQSDEQ